MRAPDGAPASMYKEKRPVGGHTRLLGEPNKANTLIISICISDHSLFLCFLESGASPRRVKYCTETSIGESGRICVSVYMFVNDNFGTC
ncbi:hypothetical protein Trydic_g6999 [Trypoxylus dichotomus]